MSKEITKANILQEIQDKFKLRELEPEKFAFLESVRPTYNIGPHLGAPTSSFVQKSVTAGPAAYIFHTVPGDERWLVNGYNVVFMAAGAYKVTGVYVFREGGSTVYLDMTEGQTVSYAVNLPKVLDMRPKDALVVYVDDYTSTADLRLYVDYTKEIIR